MSSSQEQSGIESEVTVVPLDRTDWAVFLAVVAAATLLYFESAFYVYFAIDDNEYLFKNDVVPNGLTLSGVWTAFTTFQVVNYHPLTMLTFMLERSLFGVSPMASHIINIALHALNCGLLFCAIRYMTGARLPAAFAALLFALHPLHVEAVVWVSSRKDVLSSFFWIVSLIFYARYVLGERRRDYWLAFAALVAGLFSKQMLVTAPFLFLLLDYWPLRRYPDYTLTAAKTVALVREKIPLFIAVIAFSVLAFMAQSAAGAIASTEEVSLGDRFANMWVAYVAYVAQTIAPVQLQMSGYQTPIGLPLWTAAAACVAVVGTTVASLSLRKHAPYFFVGWCWFLGTLVPVIGIVSIGLTYRADRYAYFSVAGLFIVVAWALHALYLKLSAGPAKNALLTAGLIALVIYGLVASHTVGLWKDNVTALTHTVALNPHHPLAGFSLAFEYRQAGELQKAITTYTDLLEHDPDHTDAHMGIAEALVSSGRITQAIPYAIRYTELSPDAAFGYLFLAQVQVATGNAAGAYEALQAGLKNVPGDPSLTQAIAQFDPSYSVQSQ